MDKISYNPFLSVRGKILCLIIAVTLVTGGLVGGYFFHQTSKHALQIANDGLASEASLVTMIAQAAYSELGNDVFVISKTPPVQGLIRSIGNKGVDSLDKSTTQLWINRMETIFTSIISAKPSYLQIRYIGVADGGRELVRVDRSENGIVKIRGDELQQKGEENYFKEALGLKPGEIYYSEVSLNREHGKVEIPFRPVIRVIVPVFDEEQTMYGMIVINATYKELLRSALNELKTDKDLYIIARSGDFIHYSHEGIGGDKFEYVSSAESPEEYPVIQSVLHSEHDTETRYEVIDNQEIVIHSSRQYFNPSNQRQYFTTAVTKAKDDFLAPVYQAQRNTVILTITLMVIVTMFAMYFSARIMRPLREMTEEISGLSDDLNITNLPTHLHDDIGALARAFEGLVDRTKQANAELYRTSHDLRSPLMSSIGLLDMVKTNLNEGDHEDAMESLGYIDKSLKKVEMLVYDVLQLTKARSEQEASVEIDIEQMIEDVLKRLQYMDGFENLEIKKDLQCKDTLIAQRGRVELIIENLVSNAVKYQDKEKDVSFLKIATYKEKNSFIIEVSDNGIGIPEDQQKNLFVMFKRFHPRISFGSGLGLYIIRKSADVLNGEISFERQEEGGSTFRLKLPL